MGKGQITDYFVRHSTRDKTHKKCIVCKVWLPKRKFGNNRSKKDGLATECRICHNVRNLKKNISEERIRNTKLSTYLKKYEITEREYFGRLKETNYNCPICDRKLRHIDDTKGEKSTVDHLPGTGLVYLKNKKTVHSGIPSVTRGVICDDCNNCLGRGDDSMLILIKSARYLMKWGSRRHHYLSSEKIDEYRGALKEALEELDGKAETWDSTYRT